jgi:molybdenum cofactor biosynthesis enzyme MoaA
MCQYAFSEAPGYQLNQVGEMPPALFHKLMDEVLGHPIVTFTGGEPLLHPNMADFVVYAKRYGRFCTITTNGWMLEKRARVPFHPVRLDPDESLAGQRGKTLPRMAGRERGY